jgi:hypothetical protein
MPRVSLGLLLLSVLCACSGNELVGVHVALQPDGSAIVTTRALVDQPMAAATAGPATGVTWQRGGSLVYSQGSTTELAQVRFGDDSLSFQPRFDGEPKTLRVIVRRGAEAGWVKALTPATATRRALAKVYDPSGKTKEIADQLRLEVQGLTEVVGSSALPAARGVTADRDGNRAFLVIPASTALDSGPELVWDITWK